MRTFSESQQTKLITLDFAESLYRIVPILGWVHLQGNTAYPVLPIRNGGVTFGSAYLFASGEVYDPINELSFDHINDWVEFIQSATPPKGKIIEPRGDNVLPVTVNKSRSMQPEDDAVVDRNFDDEEAEAHAAGHGSYEDVEFGAKTYKSNSFWVLPDVCVFTVPGEEPYPKSGAEKVKRVEYNALKRGDAGLPEVDYWELRTDVPAVTEAEDEVDHDDVL